MVNNIMIHKTLQLCGINIHLNKLKDLNQFCIKYVNILIFMNFLTVYTVSLELDFFFRVINKGSFKVYNKFNLLCKSCK